MVCLIPAKIQVWNRTACNRGRPMVVVGIADSPTADVDLRGTVVEDRTVADSPHRLINSCGANPRTSDTAKTDDDE